MAEQCDILGPDGFRCVLWLGHRETHELDTYQNPLLTDRDREAVREYRCLWENRNIDSGYRRISREVLEYVKPRYCSLNEIIGTVIHMEAFGQDSVDWLVVGCDYERGWYYLRKENSGFNGLEPMLSTRYWKSETGTGFCGL